ncbi:unnamed protein product, partial [Oikopleura dioica]
ESKFWLPESPILFLGKVTQVAAAKKIKIKKNFLFSHLPLLKFLIGFLSQVANEESTNKMGSPQLAIVFGPCLFWNNSPSRGIEDIGTINNLIKWLIDHHEKIFC